MEYGIKEIAKELDMHENSIKLFIRFCIETGYKDIPTPLPFRKQKYVWSEKDANKIIKWYIEKPWGLMGDFNYNKNYGSAYRKNHNKKQPKK